MDTASRFMLYYFWSEKMEKATFGLDENIAAALTYFLGFITGIIFLIMEKENKTVRFHAMQSTIVSVVWVVVVIILSMFLFFLPFGWVISNLISLAGLLVWLFLMYKAYTGEKFMVPVAGEMAENQVK
jgi:uncharacterized membrane protein